MKKIYINLLAVLVLSVQTANGQTWWSQNSNSSERLQNVNFYDNHSGYLFGDTLSTTIKTNNKGVPWSEMNMSFTEASIRSSALPSSSVIYAVGVYDAMNGAGMVMISQNSGMTWDVNTAITEDLFDVSFISTSRGFISGENGYIARTVDAGATWVDLNTGTDQDLFSIHFVSENEGWAVGTVDVNATIIHTQDGGANWTLQTSGLVDPLNAVDFVDADNGWAVGENGGIVSTTDGGTTWTVQPSNTTESLTDVDFVDANNGWAVGAGGTVLKTTDGGTTWVAENSGTTADILSIKMRSTTLGWICGDNGEVHVYAENPPTLSLGEEESVSVQLYPNPVRENLVIQLDHEVEQAEIKLFSTEGKLIQSSVYVAQQQNILDLSALTPGIYIVKIETTAGITSHRIVKQ